MFTRDPARYLIGGTLGAVWKPGASVVALGPEGELYMDRWTLEAWAGAARVHPDSGPDRTGIFAMGDIAYYPHDNLRLSAGLSVLDGFAALHLGGEYLFNSDSMPMALTGDARLGQDGSILATVGLRFYFGGQNKTLIERHRQDDPWDRGASLFTAVGNVGAPAKTTPPTVPTSTDPPPTNPPVTDPPVTDPPVTDPPVTDPPVTNPAPTDPTPSQPVTIPACPDPVGQYYDDKAGMCLPNPPTTDPGSASP